MPKPPLTAKQARFVELFLALNNATQAARQAGYSPKSAKQAGTENLAKPAIQAAITAGRAKLSAKTEVSAERLDRELELIAHSDLADVFQPGERGTFVLMKPWGELSERARKAIASIKVRREVVRTGTTTQGKPVMTEYEIVELKLWDKLNALEKLARRFPQFAKRHEVSGVIKVELLDVMGDALLRALQRRLAPEVVTDVLLEVEEIFRDIRARAGVVDVTPSRLDLPPPAAHNGAEGGTA